jgi:O-antigen/teichoic acid export membrane protein
MKGKKRIAFNMVAQFISFVLNMGISLVLTPYVTEHVGKEVYGFVNLALQMTSYVTIVTSALNSMLGRYILVNTSKKNYDEANKYFASVSVANIGFSAALVLPAAAVVYYLNVLINIPTQYVSDVKILWGFIFANFILSLATECFQTATYVSNRLDLQAVRTMESNILKVIMLFLMYRFMVSRVWYIGVSTFVCGLFIIVTNIYYTKKLTPELQIRRKYIDLKAVIELTKVGIWNSVNQLSQNLINGLDMLLTNLFVGASQMTLMGFAKAVPTYILSLIGIVCGSFAPQLTMTYAEGDTEKFVKQVNSSCRICGFICSVPILGYLAFGTSFFRLWLPTLTPDEIRMVQLLSILTLSQTIFDVFLYPLYTVNSITCRLKWPVLVNLFIGIGNVVGTLVLLKTTNLGVYAVQLVSSTLLTARVFFFAPLYAANILNVSWKTFYKPLLRGIASSITVLVLFGIANYFVQIDSWMKLLLVCIIGGIIGYAISYIIVLEKNDKVQVRQLLEKKLRRRQA